MADLPKAGAPVSVQAIKLNTTVHLGDGRKLRGPFANDANDLTEGDIAEGVPADVADFLVKRKQVKIVK